MKEAFYLARTGRPGPVLVDVPKDIQQQLAVPDWGMPMAISGYMSRLPQPPQEHQLKRVVEALHGVSFTMCVQFLPFCVQDVCIQATYCMAMSDRMSCLTHPSPAH